MKKSQNENQTKKNEMTEGSVNRKDFLKKSVATLIPASLAISGLASCTPQKQTTTQSNELPKIKWNLTSSFPRGLDILFGSSEYFAKKVEALSNGKFIIRAHPAGELVPGLQVFDSIQQGTVEMGQTVSYYFIGKHPAFAFESGVPFGLDVRQQLAWLNAEGQKLFDDLFAEFNMVCLPMGNTGAQMGGWFREPVNSLEDLKGLRMRIPGLGGQVMAGLGVNVQNLSAGDIYSALERGAIDATEWVGPYDDERLGFHKIAKNYYYPGWWEPSAQFSLYINQEKWNSLPKVYQEILRTATRDTYVKVMEEYDSKNPLALQRLMKGGVKLHKYSDDILQKGREVADELMEANASKDKTYAKIYNSWKKFRTDTSYWFNEVERARISKNS